jgi:hypothetical protein
MAPGLLTLIGSGETSDALLTLHSTLLKRLAQPQLAFINTPAGFQLNTKEIEDSFSGYFKKNFGLPITLVNHLARSEPDASAEAAGALNTANYLLAGPGSPTYAVTHWRGTAVWQKAVDRWQAGAQLAFASSATIALGKWALPVYELYKVGEVAHWVDGLNLLGGLGYDLAIIPHYNNTEGRTYDTRYCFVGEYRLLALEKLLPPNGVIVGLDENTAATLDFETQTITVSGLGHLTLRHSGQEVQYGNGERLPLDRLKAENALTRQTVTVEAAIPVQPKAAPTPSVPPQVLEWAEERNRLRAEKKFAESDKLRDRITAVGYAVKDSPNGPVFTLTRVNNASALPSHLDEPDAVDWSINLLAHNNADEIVRAARSVLDCEKDAALEVVIVDNGSDDGTAEAISGLASNDERVKPIFLAADGGEGVGRNAGFRASRGAYVMVLGGHMALAGEVLKPLADTLADSNVGATGSNGLVSTDLFNFNPAPTREADAVEFYLFAFRRERLNTVGLLDEKFVFYRNIDLDWSLAFKEKGLRLVTTPNLPLTVHEHPYLRMEPGLRDKLSKKNYRRFLDKWRDRKDLLLNHG